MRALPIASNLSEVLIAQKSLEIEISTLKYEIGKKEIRKQHTLRLCQEHYIYVHYDVCWPHSLCVPRTVLSPIHYLINLTIALISNPHKL